MKMLDDNSHERHRMLYTVKVPLAPTRMIQY